MSSPLWPPYDFNMAYTLFENNHYSKVFDTCINDIVKNKHKYLNNCKFTGWYYKDYNVNKNSGIAIYMNITHINDEGYIERDKNNKFVIINIHEAYIDEEEKLKSLILHEFTHIVKQYSIETNGLLTLKETVRDESEDIINDLNIDISDKLISCLDVILYMLSPNEQSATINAACKYISELNYKTVKGLQHDMYLHKKCNYIEEIPLWVTSGNVVAKSGQVLNILSYINHKTDSSIHFLKLFADFLNTWKTFPNTFKLILCYSLDKHRMIKTPYIRKNIIQLYNMEIYPTTVKSEFNICYEYIKNISKTYTKKLTNAVYTVMEENKLFV